jgi:hypothetical protein
MTEISPTIAGIPLTFSAQGEDALDRTIERENEAGFRNSETSKNLEEQGVDSKYLLDRDKPPPEEYEDIDAFDAWAAPPGYNPNFPNTIQEETLVDPKTSYGQNMRDSGLIVANYLRTSTAQRPIGSFGESPTGGQIDTISDSVSTESKVRGFAEATTSLDKMSDQDAGQFMLEFLGQNEHNIGFATNVFMDTENMPPEVLASIAGTLDLYDKLPDFSWSGTKRLSKGLFTDLSTYVGLSSLKGVKTLLEGGSKLAGKKILRDQMLNKLLGSAFVGVEGAGYAVMMDLFKQKSEAGDNPFVYNKEQGLLAAGIGFAAGGALTAGMVNAGAIGKSAKAAGGAILNAGKTAAGKLGEFADTMIPAPGQLNMGLGPVETAALRKEANENRFGVDDEFEAYRKRVDPDGRTIPEEDRPNLRMGDMYGMLPKNAEVVGELDGGITLHRGPKGDYYATANNPDLGESDVVGFIMGRDNGTELAVVQEMQGKGIGSELQYLFRSENPLAPTGGLTEAGARRLESTFDRLNAEELIPQDTKVQHAIPTEADNPNSIINMVYNADDSVPMAPLNAPRKRWTKAVLGKVMDQQARTAGRVITKYNDKSRETVSDTIANEAVAALNREGNASDWYNSKITEMNDVLQEIHPELVPGSTNEGAFKIGLAMTSNGSTVDFNLKAADHIYRVFKDTGKFPTDLKSMTKAVGGFGLEGPTLVLQMERANNIIDEMGADKFIEFLNTKFTTKELTDMGYKLNGEGVDYETYGSAIFGPKIGGGFYQNLRGNFEPVTFDRWWMASWGRWTGNSLEKKSKKTREDRLKRFREVSGSESKTEKALINQATKIFKVYAKNNFQPRTELNQAAQRVAEGAKDKMREQPGGSGERTFMRSTVAKALEKMKAMGYDITPADLQATVWYPEKELHGKYKIGSGRSAPDDYAAAAYRMMEQMNAR